MNAPSNVTFKKGDLRLDDARYLVNAVNCAGAMGAGLALQFRERWPIYYQTYKTACEHGLLKPGQPTLSMMDPPHWDRTIISFPTKDHWRDASQVIWIKQGLDSLHKTLKVGPRESIAFPKLGCGHGGLDWEDVLPLILAFAERNPDIDIRIYGEAP